MIREEYVIGCLRLPYTVFERGNQGFRKFSLELRLTGGSVVELGFPPGPRSLGFDP